MYKLLVFNPAQPDRPLTIELDDPAEVLEMFRRFVRDYPDCERIEVHGPRGLLFSSDPAVVPKQRQHADMIL